MNLEVSRKVLETSIPLVDYIHLLLSGVVMDMGAPH